MRILVCLIFFFTKNATADEFYFIPDFPSISETPCFYIGSTWQQHCKLIPVLPPATPSYDPGIWASEYLPWHGTQLVQEPIALEFSELMERGLFVAETEIWHLHLGSEFPHVFCTDGFEARRSPNCRSVVGRGFYRPLSPFKETYSSHIRVPRSNQTELLHLIETISCDDGPLTPSIFTLRGNQNECLIVLENQKAFFQQGAGVYAFGNADEILRDILREEGIFSRACSPVSFCQIVRMKMIAEILEVSDRGQRSIAITSLFSPGYFATTYVPWFPILDLDRDPCFKLSFQLHYTHPACPDDPHLFALEGLADTRPPILPQSILRPRWPSPLMIELPIVERDFTD